MAVKVLLTSQTSLLRDEIHNPFNGSQNLSMVRLKHE